MQGCSRLLGSMDQRVVLLRSRRRGQRDRSGTGGEQLQRRVDLPVAAFRENPSACRAGVEGGCLEELPGGEAELPWALARAGVRRSDGSAVEQGGRRAAEQGGCSAGASVAAVGIRVRVQRGLGLLFVGRRGTLGVRAGRGAPRNPRAAGVRQ
jgi:hypothetical protein